MSIIVHKMYIEEESPFCTDTFFHSILLRSRVLMTLAANSTFELSHVILEL